MPQPRKPGAPSAWTEKQTATLCETIANGGGFADAAAMLPFSQRQCSDRFKAIRRNYGWQAA